MTLTLSSRVRQHLLSTLIITGIIFSTLVLQLPHSPRYAGLGADSGLFAYTGQQILAGRLLYQNVWDEKPPGIYYLDTLAMYLAGENLWSIWWLGLLWIAASISALYLFMDKLLSVTPALLGAFIFLMMVMYPDYYQGGNFTEVYALLPQVLAIGIFAQYLFSGGKSRWIFALGIITAAAFLIKPTYIAMGSTALLVTLYLDLRRQPAWQAFIHLLIYMLGLSIPLGTVAVYMLSKGTLGEMWYAVFTYNFQYTKQGFSLATLQTTISTFIANQPMAAIFAASVAFLLVFVVLNEEALLKPYRDKIQSIADFDRVAQRTWVFASIAVALPLEWILVSVSGKNFGHYFLTPLPAMTAGCAYLFAEIRSALPKRNKRDIWPILSFALLIVLFFTWFAKVAVNDAPHLSQIASLWKYPLSGSYKPDELTQYILDNSKPTETVLVWSIHPALNFLTQRRSPTRYAFILPLLMQTPDIDTRYQTFMDELSADPPALILAQPNSSSGIPFFGGKEDNLCSGCSPGVRSGFITFKRYVDAHYTLAKQIYDWQIFKRIN